ncbi:Uncharacterised protein [Phocaeicola vulgatus]|nr:Uncharacterised protein [Phocaeicola vulgatus]
MVMPYHLHMPSYFLETFTEYPYLDSVSSLIVINYDDPFILGEKDYRIKYRVQESKLYATALLGEEYVRVRNIAHK